jgi:hypothetical protein
MRNDRSIQYFKVRQLHRVQSRVQEALDTVEGTIGMKSCLEGVELAIKDCDYERATDFVSKVLNLKPKAEVSDDDEHKNSVVRAASQKLRTTVLQKFEENLHTDQITRFAKLFIPLRIEAEGLRIYESDRVKNLRDELDHLVNSSLDKICM